MMKLGVLMIWNPAEKLKFCLFISETNFLSAHGFYPLIPYLAGGLRCESVF